MSTPLNTYSKHNIINYYSTYSSIVTRTLHYSSFNPLLSSAAFTNACSFDNDKHGRL